MASLMLQQGIINTGGEEICNYQIHSVQNKVILSQGSESTALGDL